MQYDTKVCIKISFVKKKINKKNHLVKTMSIIEAINSNLIIFLVISTDIFSSSNIKILQIHFYFKCIKLHARKLQLGHYNLAFTLLHYRLDLTNSSLHCDNDQAKSIKIHKYRCGDSLGLTLLDCI